MKETPQRLLNIKGAAYYLGVSTTTVRRLVLNRELPVIQMKPRGPLLFDVRDLDAYVESHKAWY